MLTWENLTDKIKTIEKRIAIDKRLGAVLEGLYCQVIDKLRKERMKVNYDEGV